MLDRTRIATLKEEIGEDDFAEVLEMFIDEMTMQIEAINTSDPAQLTADLHALKGSASNVGFSQFAALCAEAENGVRNGSMPHSLSSKLGDCFAASRQAISGPEM